MVMARRSHPGRQIGSTSLLAEQIMRSGIATRATVALAGRLGNRLVEESHPLQEPYRGRWGMEATAWMSLYVDWIMGSGIGGMTDQGRGGHGQDGKLLVETLHRLHQLPHGHPAVSMCSHAEQMVLSNTYILPIAGIVGLLGSRLAEASLRPRQQHHGPGGMAVIALMSSCGSQTIQSGRSLMMDLRQVGTSLLGQLHHYKPQ
jgi:hypothetical protein